MRNSRLTSIFVAAGLAAACGQDSGQEAAAPADPFGPAEVAVVDGERIPESLFRLYTLGIYQVNADDLTPEGRRQFIEELVLLRVLADEAERRGLDQERRVAAELELQRIQHLARAMTQRYSEENPPTESELRDLYETNLSRLRTSQYRARHILVDTEGEAENIIEQLNQGADFAALAREHSTDTSTAQQGGELGPSSADGWVEPFAEAVRNATPGTMVATPVQTQYGWHVIRVDERQDQVAPGLEAVREDLVVGARNQKLDAFATELQEAAEVTIAE
jgi:peptidyl-prolyl cis-trans isomerase C